MNKRYKSCRRAAVLLMAGVLLFLSACGGSSKGGPATFQDGAEFSIAVTMEPDSLNPLTATSKLAEEFFLLAYDPLWRIDASGEPVNCLVDDYSLSSDQRTWTIRLREGVTFSDGEPLTSEDVQYTYQTMLIHSPIYGVGCEGISDIRCPDDRTVVITTSYVKGDMQYCPVPILPKHIWNSGGNPRDFLNDEMIGSGPFVRQMVDTGPQEISWTFQARANYFNGSANLGSVRYVYFATETGAARALSTGEVDAAIGMTDVQLTTLEGVPGVQLIQSLLPGSDIWALAFNTRKGVFQNTPMRQMVDYCIDRAWMLSMANGDVGQTGTVWAGPATNYFYTVGNQRGIDYNTARNIVYTAGYSDVDEDGIMEDLITRDDLILKLWTNAGDDWASTAATVVKSDLEEIGVRVKWETTDGSVLDVCTPKGDWDMCLLSWRGNYDPVVAASRFRTADGSLTGWSNETYDEIFARLQESMDLPTIQANAGQLQQVVYDDCPYLILAYRSDIQAVREDLWTGYDEVLAASGALFCTGSVDAYMTLTPSDAAQ